MIKTRHFLHLKLPYVEEFGMEILERPWWKMAAAAAMWYVAREGRRQLSTTRLCSDAIPTTPSKV